MDCSSRHFKGGDTAYVENSPLSKAITLSGTDRSAMYVLAHTTHRCNHLPTGLRCGTSANRLAQQRQLPTSTDSPPTTPGYVSTPKMLQLCAGGHLQHKARNPRVPTSRSEQPLSNGAAYRRATTMLDHNATIPM